jgi:hypothetical protein
VQLERRRPLSSAEAETARPPPSVRPALTVGLRGDVVRRSKRPDVALPAKEHGARDMLSISGPRQRAGAHIRHVRECPFPDMRPIENPHRVEIRAAHSGGLSGRVPRYREPRRSRDRRQGLPPLRCRRTVTYNRIELSADPGWRSPPGPPSPARSPRKRSVCSAGGRPRSSTRTQRTRPVASDRPTASTHSSRPFGRERPVRSAPAGQRRPPRAASSADRRRAVELK